MWSRSDRFKTNFMAVQEGKNKEIRETTCKVFQKLIISFQIKKQTVWSGVQKSLQKKGDSFSRAIQCFDFTIYFWENPHTRNVAAWIQSSSPIPTKCNQTSATRNAVPLSVLF